MVISVRSVCMLPHMRRNVIGIATCIGAAAILHAAPVYGKQFKCSVRNVTVHAFSDRDAADSCHGASNAIRFLASQGLSVPGSITVNVVTKMPDPVAESAMGAYMKAESEVLVLSYSAAKKRSYSSFKLPLDRPLYRAVVSHEVAHAIAAGNFKQEPSYLGQEYIAYVTLFSTMTPTQRKKILRHYPPDDDWQAHAASLYIFESLGFGAQAYRHFLKPENGQIFLRKVLDGEVLNESE